MPRQVEVEYSMVVSVSARIPGTGPWPMWGAPPGGWEWPERKGRGWLQDSQPEEGQVQVLPKWRPSEGLGVIVAGGGRMEGLQGALWANDQ